MASTKSVVKRKGKQPVQPAAPKLNKKELAAQKRKAAQERTALLGFVGGFGFVSLLTAGLIFVMAGAVPALLVGLGIFCLAFSLRYPRLALWAFFIYMPFGGTVTYTIAGGNALLQLAKDAFYLPALFSLVQYCRQRRLPILIPKGLMPILGILLAYCLLHLLFVTVPYQFKPASNTQPLWQGLLGLKVFLGYVPLIFCTYYLLASKREFLFFGRTHVVLAIVCTLLCLVQYYLLLKGHCKGTEDIEGADLFKASLDARCFVGGALLYSPSQGVIRLPGTFVAPWQWGWFLIGNAYLTFASAFCDPSPRWRTTGLVGMGLVMACSVVSGQRVALALVPISFLILLVLTGQFANIKRFLPVAAGLALLMGVGWAIFPNVIQDRINSFVDRWNASPADDMILNQFAFVWKGLDGSLVGKGLGTATNSTRMFGPAFLIETWFPKVMYEVGPIGLMLFLAFVTVLTVLTFKAYRSIKDKNLRGYAACFWVFILYMSYQTYYYPLDVDPIAIYYWAIAGALLRLPELDRQAEQEQQALLSKDSSQRSGKSRSRRRTRAPDAVSS